jgi:hypothetical protein
MVPAMRCLGWVALSVLMAAACDDSEPSVDECPRRAPSVTRGVYGCITSVDDVGDPEVRVQPDFGVEIFLEKPPATPDDGLAAYSEAESDPVGFFEIELAAGDYWICTRFRRCVELVVPESGSVRMDYELSLGPGWSP